MSARRLILAVLGALAVSPTAASALERSQLTASFSPTALGKATTVNIAFQLRDSAAALTELVLRLPTGVTAGFNALGLETCEEQSLQLEGPKACPTDSVVGDGHATVAVPLGTERLLEPVEVTMYMAPALDEHTQFVFYAKGTSPVIDQLVFGAALLGESGRFGAQIDAAIPPVPGLPGSPDASVVGLQAQLGPKDLRYVKHEHGRTITYAPEGFDVPPRCPRGGFPFAADFTFADGGHESVKTLVPCPGSRGRRSPNGHAGR